MAVTLEQRILLMKAFPCFHHFTPLQYAELVQLLEEKTVEPQDNIVIENDIIDAIYIIVNGEAEVTRIEKKNKKSMQIPLAILHNGEAIGLNDTGFYSTTGKRTATVTAVTRILLLKFDIKNLYQFLQKNHLEASMYNASGQMLRMKLIKQSLPFSKISHERLQWLAERVEEIKLAPGDVLFKEGDPGDKCYLIKSGKIEIISTQHSKARQLAILNPPALFGEATMITHAPRNATARAMTETELLLLEHIYLTELLETDNQITDMFMTLMLDRSRPLRGESVTTHQRASIDGQEITILKNPDNGNYFKLSKEGTYIWQHLDGNHTMQEITLALVDKFQLFAPNIVAGLISKLIRAGFVNNIDLNVSPKIKNTNYLIKLKNHLQRALSKRLIFNNANYWLSVTYSHFMRYFFTKPGHYITSMLIVVGLVALFVSSNEVLAFFSTHKVSMLLMLIIYPFGMISLILHELAHAYAVKAAGREIRYIGFGFSLSGLVALTDTSDMWLASRKARMMVNLAGIYADALFAAVCGILIFIVLNPYLQGLLWMIGIYTCVNAVRQLSPMQEYDGYYVLMDWMEKNRLRQHAVIWLVRKFPKCLRHPALFKENMLEVYYWLTCVLYLIIVSIMALLVQFFVLRALGLQVANPYLTLLLPIATMIISSVSIFLEIKRQKED